VIIIWWCRVNGKCFAITIERGHNVTWWGLWYHREGQWVHTEFAEEDGGEVERWQPLYGTLSRVAMVVDGRDVYMTRESVEDHSQLVWEIYIGTVGETADADEYHLLLELWTLVHPHWELNQ